MSGGQQQRVGVARALVVDPDIIFADEPTGNLDSHTSEEVMELMQRVVREQKKTLVMVTHDDHLATYADRVFHIRDGRIIKIEDNRWKKEKKREEDMQKRIQKEIGNNCLKRIIVAFLAVIMMTTMLHPQMVQAATGTENGIFIESKNNEAPVFEAGKKKNWNFVITNNSGNVLNNVTITPDLGDKNEDWPFKTEKQSYQKSLGTLEKDNNKKFLLNLFKEMMFQQKDIN